MKRDLGRVERKLDAERVCRSRVKIIDRERDGHDSSMHSCGHVSTRGLHGDGENARLHGRANNVVSEPIGSRRIRRRIDPKERSRLSRSRPDGAAGIVELVDSGAELQAADDLTILSQLPDFAAWIDRNPYVAATRCDTAEPLSDVARRSRYPVGERIDP